MSGLSPPFTAHLCLPYGEVFLKVDPRGPAVAMRARPSAPVSDVGSAARKALEFPADGPTLEAMARGARRVVVVLADATRKLPQEAMLGAVLEPLEGREVTLLVGGGLHGLSPPEALGLSASTISRMPLRQHDSRDARGLVDLGPLRPAAELDSGWMLSQAASGLASVLRRPSSRGLAGRLFRGLLALKAAVQNRLWVNRLCAEADLIVALGQISPHYLTGYSGGVKAVVPGCAGRDTIVGNHLKILHSSAQLGLVEGNVVRSELESAVPLLPPMFILNAVLAEDGRPAALVAGDPVGAHRAGVKLARSIYEVEAPEADAVIVGASHPKAMTLYQLLKVLPSAARVVRPSGAVCVAGPCPEGVGPTTLLRQILFPCYMEALLPPGVELYLLSGIPAGKTTHASPFRPVADLEDAVARLRGRAGPDGLLAVMDGSGPIIPIVNGFLPGQSPFAP